MSKWNSSTCKVANCDSRAVTYKYGLCCKHQARFKRHGHTERLIEEHGHSLRGKQSAEYRVWRDMITRCTRPATRNYHRYGGRGIAVCHEWRRSFLAFLAYVGPRPSGKYSLDRYPDNDGNYEPGNVRWATVEEQSHNQSKNVNFTIDGITRCLTEWSRASGVPRSTIVKRLSRGREPKDAIWSAPIGKDRRVDLQSGATP